MKYQRERWLLIMTPEEALTLLDTLLQGPKLKDTQELVFCYSWQGWTYPQIAQHLNYDLSYIRDVGYELWRQLSQEFGEQVTKKNVQTVLRRQVLLRQNTAESLSRSENISAAIATESPIAQTEDTPTNITVTNRTSIVTTGSNRDSTGKYWGEIIDVSSFYGRNSEFTQLQQWIVTDHCRLIAVVGMGGIGKTTLAAKLAEQTQDEFDFLIWQSLRNAPPITEVLITSIQVLSRQQATASQTSVNALISQLIEYFRSYRCLLILDNFDVVLGSTEGSLSSQMIQSGQYREGYEGYETLLRRVGSELHSSCLLLTSREKPKILIPLEGSTLPVRTLFLTGLRINEIQDIFSIDGCFSTSETDWQRLLESYAGNPLSLKIVSTTVRDIFDGSISDFLEHGAIAFGDINLLLDEQFRRLSDLEKHVMYWLAINREWLTLAELREDFVPSPPQHNLLEALLSLVRRSLIEKSAGSFTLQPVVMEYVAEFLLEQICEELGTQELNLFISHALIKAQAKDYIRASQIRLILAPLVERLICQFRSKKEVEYQLQGVLFKLRSEFPTTVGYAGGNTINLLRQLQINLSGYDFSHLSIRQAHLQDLNLHHVNLAYSELIKSTFTQTFGSILSIAFSPDDRLLAAAGVNANVYLWHVIDSQQALTLKGHTNWVLSVAFSPDGLLLASCGEDCTIKLWDVSTGICSISLQGHTDYVHSVTFSPDGRFLASSSIDQTLKLWDVQTGYCLKTFHGHTSWIERVVFNSSGQMLASSSNDRTIKLWSVNTSECEKTLHGHSEQVSSVAFSPDDKTLASGSGDRTIKIWDAVTGQCLNTLNGHSSQIWSVAFSADGNLLASGSHDRTIKLWDAISGECLKTFHGHASQVRSIAFNANSSILASGGGDQTIRFWDVNTGQRLKTWQGYNNGIWAIAFNTDGTLLASGSYDCLVRVWDVNTGECLRTLHGHSSWVRTVAFSPDNRTIASGSGDQTVKLWDANTGECLRTLHGHSSWIRSIAFSPDGVMLVSASHDRTLRLWNLNTYQSDRVLSVNTSWTRGVAFMPQRSTNSDESLLVGCLDETTMGLWDVSTGELLRTFEGHTAQIWSAAFSPNGQILASSSRDQTVKLWDTNTGQCMRTLEGHTRDVWSAAFSTDGLSLATGGDDRTVRIWDVSTGRLQAILEGHDGSIQSVVYSPDACILASGSEDETIKIWDIQTTQCLRILRSQRPYEDMDITGVTGLTEAQKMTLIALGAIEHSEAG